MKRRPIIDLATHESRYVTPPELAAYFHCDVRTILRLIHEESLVAVRVGRCWRIPIDEAREKFHAEHTSRRTA